MDEQSSVELVKGYGYRPLPGHHPASPAYSGVLVTIRKQPTDSHFDPLALRLEETFHEFHHALRREKDWLVAEGEWPDNPPVVEDLLLAPQ